MKNEYINYVPIFKALSDETRLKVVDMLSCGELCACDILEKVNISQSTLSYHMKILTESGLINSRKDGPWVKYSIDNKKRNAFILFSELLTKDKDECLCKDLNVDITKCYPNKLVKSNEVK